MSFNIINSSISSSSSPLQTNPVREDESSSILSRVTNAASFISQKLDFPGASASYVSRIISFEDEEFLTYVPIDKAKDIPKESESDSPPYLLIITLVCFVASLFIFVCSICSYRKIQKNHLTYQKVEEKFDNQIIANAQNIPNKRELIQVINEMLDYSKHFNITRLEKNHTYEFTIVHDPSNNNDNIMNEEYFKKLSPLFQYKIVEFTKHDNTYKIVVVDEAALKRAKKAPKKLPPPKAVEDTSKKEQETKKLLIEKLNKFFGKLFASSKVFSIEEILNDTLVVDCHNKKIWTVLEDKEKYRKRLGEIIGSEAPKMIREQLRLFFLIKNFTPDEKGIDKAQALIAKLEQDLSDELNNKVIDESKWDTDIQSLQEFNRLNQWESSLYTLFASFGVLTFDRKEKEMSVHFVPKDTLKPLLIADEESLTIIAKCLNTLAEHPYNIDWDYVTSEIVFSIPNSLDISGNPDNEILARYDAPSIAVKNPPPRVEVVVTPLDETRTKLLSETILAKVHDPFEKRFHLVRFLEIYKFLTFLSEAEQENARDIRNALVHHQDFTDCILDSLYQTLLSTKKYDKIKWNEADIKFCKTLLESQRNREILDKDLIIFSLESINKRCLEFLTKTSKFSKLGIILALRDLLQQDNITFGTKKFIEEQIVERNIPGWINSYSKENILTALGNRIAHSDELLVFDDEIQTVEKGLPAFIEIIQQLLKNNK